MSYGNIDLTWHDVNKSKCYQYNPGVELHSGMSNMLGHDICDLENILWNLAPDGRRIINVVIAFCSKVKSKLMVF